MRRLLVLLAALWTFPAAAGEPPAGFADVAALAPDIRCELRYLGSDNFVGRPVDGYRANRCLLTRPAAEALARAQAELRPFGLGLLLFDGYRPQRAVDHFVRWSQDATDTATKARYYPALDKSRLFPDGYISARSGHTRGSTVDLTLVGQDGTPLDMGSPFDFFGPESWPAYARLTPAQHAHRLLLRTLMTQHGFKPYEQEWWHFTLKDEPFPDTYFDFPVE